MSHWVKKNKYTHYINVVEIVSQAIIEFWKSVKATVSDKQIFIREWFTDNNNIINKLNNTVKVTVVKLKTVRQVM